MSIQRGAVCIEIKKNGIKMRICNAIESLEARKAVQGEKKTGKSEDESFERAIRDLRTALDNKTEENVSLKASLREKDIQMILFPFGTMETDSLYSSETVFPFKSSLFIV
ncbi:MAG TPA: hypothetical protein DCP92_24485 [Nitrospiraceae bacterium]|nr:hypothetical protein [Nitrospiraceae bacterium]